MLGPSGCGKSTLLRAVAGLEHARRRARVAYDGQDLAAVPTHRRGFALMFQDGQLFPHQSVAGNVGYPLRLRRRPRADVGGPGRRAARPGRARRVGRPAAGDAVRRRAAAGGAGPGAGRRPRLLLLDEPLSALDRGLRERLAGDLRDILRQPDDGAAGHPRPRRGVRGRRPDGGDARRPGRADRHPRRGLAGAGRRGGGTLPRLRRRCSTGEAGGAAARRRGRRAPARRARVGLRRVRAAGGARRSAARPGARGPRVDARGVAARRGRRRGRSRCTPWPTRTRRRPRSASDGAAAWSIVAPRLRRH